MEDCHKEQVIKRYHRLCSTISKPEQLTRGTFTHKSIAREQLARMALVIRDYELLHRSAIEQGASRDHKYESMATDILDASLSVQGTEPSIFPLPQLMQREEEIASLMTLAPGRPLMSTPRCRLPWISVPALVFPTLAMPKVVVPSVTVPTLFAPPTYQDVVYSTAECRDLCSRSTPTVPPKQASFVDLGKDIDWSRPLLPSKTESNIVYRYRKSAHRRQRLSRKDLMEVRLEDWNLRWPPES